MTSSRKSPIHTAEGPEQRSRPLSEYSLADFYSASGESDDPFGLLEPFEIWWQDALKRGWHLVRRVMKSPPAARVTVQSRNKTATNRINFSSYNYLGLSYRPEVIDAAARALNCYGLGSAGALLLSGITDLHEQLASDLADSWGARPSCCFRPATAPT